MGRAESFPPCSKAYTLHEPFTPTAISMAGKFLPQMPPSRPCFPLPALCLQMPCEHAVTLSQHQYKRACPFTTARYPTMGRSQRGRTEYSASSGSLKEKHYLGTKELSLQGGKRHLHGQAVLSKGQTQLMTLLTQNITAEAGQECSW